MPLNKQSGFTLIEIMVVVIIIAVMSVAVVSSLGGNNDRAARLQANRFMAVVNEVRDEAIIAGDNYALIVDDKVGSYRFESMRSQAVAVTDSLFKNRLVDKKVTLDWEVYEVFDDDNETDPRVLISSLGEITPFEARFGGTELSYVVLLNDEGQLQRLDQKSVKF
ncbi:MAG: general secretion pathway protein H [Arenicella sp.]|jgi:general secretion pathway protein H